MRIVVDSYAWIEFFAGSERGARVKDLLANYEAYVPDVVLAEIARKYLREGVGEEEVRGRVEWITDVARTVPIDEEIALLSAKCYFELLERARGMKVSAPGLVDGVVLAAGRKLGAKVVTGDRHFRGLEDVIWIGVD